MNTEHVASVSFPEPASRSVNMMPFVIGDLDTVPEELAPYREMIELCDVEEEQNGEIGYLTVMESAVKRGVSQRRGGIHTERHPASQWGGGGGWGGGFRASARWGGGSGWGRGRYSGRRLGGLYLASTLEDSTAVWDARIEDPGPGGDCEHLADQLGVPRLLQANELVWMTDCTPHASMPVKRDGSRQFFRLVTREVDLWFAAHSTPNPLGVELPERVQVIEGDKFAA